MNTLNSPVPRSDLGPMSRNSDVENLRIGLFTLLDCSCHGGLESYTRQLAGTLQAAGHRVTINGMPPEKCSGMSDTWQPRVARLLPLMTRRRARWVARIAAEWWGRKWCEQATQECDIVHFIGTGWDLLGFPLVKAARRAHQRISCLPAVHSETWGDANIDIDLYQRMDSVFVLSEFEAMHLNRLGVASEKLVRCGCAPELPNTVGDGSRFRARHGLENKLIVLFIGRKSRGKGYHAIREAVADLALVYDDIALVSIGRDVEPPYPKIDTSIDIDLGAADDATKQDALAACDVFALPSEAESFGIVYVEAWTHGKAVICGTAPASRELVTRNNGGLITDGTAREIKVAIQTLLRNPDRRDRMGKNGRAAATAMFTPEKVAQQHLQIWRASVRTVGR